MKAKKLFPILALVLVFSLVAPILHQRIAHAATLTVDSTLDDSDISPGDGFCDTGGGICTLRAAIDEANTLPGADTINFAIAGAGVHTITPASVLIIDSQITIDGSTQPGSSCGTLVPAGLPASNTPHTLQIAINGGTTNQDTFRFQAVNSNNSVIKGMNLTNQGASNAILQLNSADGLDINCNYIGTNTIGTADGNNGANTTGIGGTGGAASIQNNLISSNFIGVNLLGGSTTIQNNLIGLSAQGVTALSNQTGVVAHTGPFTITHNVIAGNGQVGVELDGAVSSSIKSNYIGLNITAHPLGNGGDGVTIHNGVANAVIGGINDAERNFIAANLGHGLHIYKTACDADPNTNQVLNNYIGTNVDGQVEDGFGNHLSGVAINEYATSCIPESVYRNSIGGDSDSLVAGQHLGNVIAGNLEDGVSIFQSPGSDVRENPIIGNHIFGNGRLGLNLAEDSDDDGVADTNLGNNSTNNFTINNPSQYANSFINSPTVTAVSRNGSQLTMTYNFTANTPDPSVNIVGYRLDFYQNDSLNSNGQGEGQHHLGWFVVDGSENGSTHTFMSNEAIVSGATNITATATALIANGCPCGMENHAAPSLLSRVSDFFMPKASAQELDAGSLFYDLGPTSEFGLAYTITDSPVGASSQLIRATNTPQLANTGQDVGASSLFADIVAILSIVAVGIVASRPRQFYRRGR